MTGHDFLHAYPAFLPVQKCKGRHAYHERNITLWMLLSRFFVYIHNAKKNDIHTTAKKREKRWRCDIDKQNDWSER